MLPCSASNDDFKKGKNKPLLTEINDFDNTGRVS